MRRTLVFLVSLCLLTILVGCASEGGDPTEAVPKDVFQVVYVPSIAGVWDGVEYLIAELRQVEPRMAEEAVRKIEGLVWEMFGSEEPPVESLQELWDEGVDVYKPFIVAVGGFPVPQPVILVSLHTPSSFSDLYYESIGEEKPEPIETYSDVDVRLSRGFYSAQTDGLFIASESFPLMKSCIDALGDPEARFFEGESIRPLLANYSDYTAALFVDLGSVKGFMALAMTQAPDVPGFVRDWMTRVESIGLGLKIQPEGIRLTAGAFGDFGEVEEMVTDLPVPQDCLAFFGGGEREVSLHEKTELARMLVTTLSMHPDAAEFIEAVGEDNMISLILSIGQRSFLFVHDAGWMPGVTFGLELADPELFKLIYDEKLRPLLESAINEELSAALLEHRVGDDVEMDVLTLSGPLILPIAPAVAFYDDYLILTTDAGCVEDVRDVDRGRAKGVYTNEDYLLAEKQLSGYQVGGFVSADELVKLLAMTPGLELPEAVRLLGGYFQLVSLGGGLKDGLAEGVLLVSTRTYSPDSTIPQSEISTGLPWWLWLVIGLGALLIVILLVVLLGRRRREV